MAAASERPKSVVIPDNLSGFLSAPKTPWWISPVVFSRLSKTASQAHYSCQLREGDPEFNLAVRYFANSKPPGLGIKNVVCVFNHALTKVFEASLYSMEAAAKKFPPSWRGMEPKQAREQTFRRWDSQTTQFSRIHLTSSKRTDKLEEVRVVPLFHGTKPEHLDSICSSNFTIFGKHHLNGYPSAGAGKIKSTDKGYFGNGLYFTNSAHYASMYGSEVIMMACVSMREPFPVVSDVASPNIGSDQTLLEGQGSFRDYNCHYAPVTSVNPKDPEEMCFNACHNETPAWDEYVVFQSSQTLPYIYIVLGVDFPKSPSAITSDSILSVLFALLQIPQFRTDIDNCRIVKQRCATMLLKEAELDPSDEDRQFYLWAIDLLAKNKQSAPICAPALCTLLEKKESSLKLSAENVNPAMKEVGKEHYKLDRDGNNGLHRAVIAGDRELVRELSKTDLLNMKNRFNRTPIFVAAEQFQEDIFKILFDAKADISGRDSVSNTLLHSAALNGCVEACKLLVGAGADVNATGNVNMTVLRIAGLKNRNRKEVVQYLESAGARNDACVVC